MSQPKRYFVTPYIEIDDKGDKDPQYVVIHAKTKQHEHEQGWYVEHKDYAALQAENERLRKAGDAMAECLCSCYDYGYDDRTNEAEKAWRAAKGVQS